MVSYTLRPFPKVFPVLFGDWPEGLQGPLSTFPSAGPFVTTSIVTTFVFIAIKTLPIFFEFFFLVFVLSSRQIEITNEDNARSSWSTLRIFSYRA